MKFLPLAAAVLALATTTAFAQTKPAAAPAATTKPAAPVPAAAGGFSLKPGLWETTLATETAGSTSKRSTVGRVCLTAADASDFRRVIPQQREAGMKCDNTDAKAQGANATWKVTCASKEDSMSGTGELASAGNTYSGKGEFQLKKKGAPKPAKVTQTFSGRWIEACK